jgi:hypothetical protein
MATDHNDIYSIVERLRILEEGLTPTTVKHGLNKQQKSVDQLSATFKPKTVAVLTAKKDPKNPLAGKLVGDSAENNKEPVDEAVATEDTLSKVKASFADYLKNVVDEVKQDSDLRDKTSDDTDLKKKDTKDRALVAKELDENGVAETAPVKTVTNKCGLWEIHGNEPAGFEIRHGNRAMRSRFKTIEECEMALEMFAARRAKQNESADYIEEA